MHEIIIRSAKALHVKRILFYAQREVGGGGGGGEGWSRGVSTEQQQKLVQKPSHSTYLAETRYFV